MSVVSPTRRSFRESRTRHRAHALLLGAVLASSAVLGAGVLAGTAAAASPTYTFTTINNASDPTFNQLLGINLDGVISGYFGSGAKGHPNQGYLLYPPYAANSYVAENFPHALQTQVTGLNDLGVSVGFYSRQNNANLVNSNYGFYVIRGHAFHTVRFPGVSNAKPAVNQLLGVNDNDIAVGFYNDAAGNSHGYRYNILTHSYHAVVIPGRPTSTTATAINIRNDVAGFTTIKGVTEAFLLRRGGHFEALQFPGATATQAFGLNDQDEVVGQYTTGSGTTAMTHGFVWTPTGGFTTVDDPNGIGATTINGVNNFGEIVGFYTDTAGNTDGFLATPTS